MNYTLCAMMTVALVAGAALANGLGDERRLEIERLSAGTGPSVNLSVVYRSLPPEARQALMAKVKQLVLTKLPPDILQHPSVGQLPPEAQKLVAAAVTFLQATTPEQMDAFVQTQDLDHLLPLPPAVFRVFHDRMDAQAVPGTTTKRRDLMAADLAEPSTWMDAVGRTAGYVDEGVEPPSTFVFEDAPTGDLPHDGVTETSIQGLVTAHRLLDVPAPVLANSQTLAMALNYLTDPRYDTTPLTVDLFGRTVTVSDGVALFDHLLATGRYDVTLYDARMFVDFLGYSVRHGEGTLPVKIPTWAATTIDPLSANPEVAAQGNPPKRPFIVPANHSEHLLVLFERGTVRPAMLVKWYMGIPSAGSTVHQGTRFKAAIWQHSSWSGFRCFRTYEGAESARQCIRAGSALMQLFNFLQGRFRYPMNGYGVLAVCQDTTALMEVVLQGTAARSTVWPLVRDPRLDPYYRAVIETVGLSLDSRAAAGDGVILNVPSDARPDLYPWTLERKVELNRVGANMPTRDLGTLHFPLVRDGATLLAEKSPVFRRALSAW